METDFDLFLFNNVIALQSRRKTDSDNVSFDK